MFYTRLRYLCASNIFTKIRFLILFLLIGLISHAQSYTYTAESFEQSVWASAPNTNNPIVSSTGTWTAAKNNIQSTGVVTANSGTYCLVLAQKTNSLITPILDNGAGVLTYNVIKTGSRTITVSSTTDAVITAGTVWTNIDVFVALSTWSERKVILENQNIRYIKFDTNSTGGTYLDDILITSNGSSTISVQTTAAVDLQDVSAVVGGTIAATGGDIITSRGVCYGTTGYIDVNSSKVAVSGTTGSFSATLNGLAPNTTYYAKAYSVSAKGINYGPQISFVTRPADLLTYWTQPFQDSAIMPTSATAIPEITFNVPNQGDWTYYGSFKNTNSAYVVDGSGSSLRVPKNGTYVITPLLNSGVIKLTFDEGRGARALTVYTSLDGGATWAPFQTITTIRGNNSVTINNAVVNRIKIANESGSDSDIDNISITGFPSGTKATLTTVNGSSIQKNAAVAGGNITAAGDKGPVTERGVCWSTLTFPFTADHKVASGSGLGSFTCSLTDLPAGRTIHIRAYAITNAGTAYGDELTFNTLPATIPILATTTASQIKGETAVAGGVVSDNGGAAIAAEGICWNTTGNPTIADSKTTDTSGTATFSTLLKNLTPNTTYYYRAYATNETTTGYGAVATFTTTAVTLPQVTTLPVSSLLYFKAKGNGEVTNDGNAWTTRGICWSLTPNPTIANNKTVCGVNEGTFTGDMLNLVESTTYYIRAYAINSVGTVYGNEITFTTPASTWLSEPIGYGEGTTGGGTPTASNTITVTNATELEAALKGTKSVILVFGTITLNAPISIVLKNKSLIGLPGATIYNTERLIPEKTGNISLGAGSHNVIIRNILFKGAGAYDVDGNDLISNYGCTKLWVDHCEFQDGVDDSFDNTGSADDVTISWCKFSNLIPYKSGGPGGSSDHRFANLIGGGDEAFPADGHYSVTFQNVYYGAGIVARMARARNADVHYLNSYWNSPVASDNIGFTGGVNGSTLYLESSVFSGVGDAVQLDGPQPQSVLFYDTTYGGLPLTKPNYGDAVDAGLATPPTYDYKPMNRTDVVAAVSSTSCGAGATLLVSAEGIITSNCTPSPILTSTANTIQDVFTGNAITTITYIWGGTATGASVSGLPAGLTSVVNPTNKTLIISGTPTVDGTYTVATTGGTAGVTSKQGTITITSIPPPTVTTPANKSQTVVVGTAIDPIVYTWGGGATDLNVTALPSGITSAKDSGNKTLTLSGIPTALSTYTVTTVGGTGVSVSVSGTIKLKATAIVPKVAYVTNSSSISYVNDSKIFPALNSNIYMDVTEVSTATVKPAGFYDAYDLVIFSEVSGSTDAGIAQLKGLNKPFIMMKVHSYKMDAAAWSWASSGYGQEAYETNLVVANKTHPMFKDVTWINGNEVQVLSAVDGAKGITYMNPASFNSVSGGIITSLASVKGFSSNVSIFEVPAGTNISGTLIPQKFIQIGLNSASYANVTDDGVSIVKNAAYYLLNVTLGINNPVDKKTDEIQLYPTLAKDVVYIKSAESEIKSVQIYSMDGRQLENLTINDLSAELNLSGFKNGMYLVLIKTANGETIRKVLVTK
ncbi:Por secretion system C-terminal sorting domain-containing protein [Flavobacterium fluvii]|uniref:Por secretion system C-terminal sorting domain-containing protein n=1 Tax=Flavobacterium fluvii TaxID=468056 RepID=A0A1M5HB68_9FLAO|nr:T9SS type A sorting domain-containing protein [Flavobacterium fluvii]SHG13194.1 Por secretion system C-terminal sorting domain-containing protein [Flavobacterium fluvii]